RYLNSPESVLYHKADLLLGLQPGRQALQAGAVPVVVEGAFDAMAVTRCGDGHYVGVAPSGTALTARQVAALDQVVGLADRGVIIAFDGDTAGRTAAAATFPTLAATGAWPGHATLPDGADPASLPDTELRDALDQATDRPLAHLAIGHAVWPHHDMLDSPGGREAAVRDIVRALAPATAHDRVQALLPSAATLANTDLDTVQALLDRQRQDSAAPERPNAPDRREDLDRGQGTVTGSPAAQAHAAYPTGLTGELTTTPAAAGRTRQPGLSASRRHR
ncbi:MAG: toprim domain-containing protein, partial [Mycobacteriales bacterium]